MTSKTVARGLAVATIPLLALVGAVGSGERADGPRRAVERAALDYVEALYEVDPGRIDRSVHPSMHKVGYYRRSPAEPYRELRMTQGELRALAAEWNREGTVDPARGRKEVVVLDVLDQTATARVTAEWGVDHLHLARIDDRWQILGVLWQSHPETSDWPGTAGGLLPPPPLVFLAGNGPPPHAAGS